MPRKTGDRQPSTTPAQASLLSQEVLSQIKRNSEEWVRMDDDSMENIDTYWEMANQELKDMGDQLSEELAHPPEASERPAAAVSKRVEPERKSFDEEFEKNLDNVILSGFSDSSEGELAAAKDLLQSGEPLLRRKTSVQRMSFLPEPVVLNSLIQQNLVPEDSEASGDGATGEPGGNGRGWQTQRRTASLPKKETDKPVTKAPARKRKALLPKQPARSAPKAADAPPAPVIGAPNTKEIVNSVLLKSASLSIRKLTVRPKKRRQLPKHQMYYILTGSLLVSHLSSPQAPLLSYVYQDLACTGRQLKAGGVFASESPITVYNPGSYPCTLLGLQSLAPKK